MIRIRQKKGKGDPLKEYIRAVNAPVRRCASNAEKDSAADPKTGKWVGVAAAWIASAALVVWAALDVFGPAGAKTAAAAILAGLGGWQPLGRVMLGGLILYPPKEWGEGEGEEEK